MVGGSIQSSDRNVSWTTGSNCTQAYGFRSAFVELKEKTCPNQITIYGLYSGTCSRSVSTHVDEIYSSLMRVLILRH